MEVINKKIHLSYWVIHIICFSLAVMGPPYIAPLLDMYSATDRSRATSVLICCYFCCTWCVVKLSALLIIIPSGNSCIITKLVQMKKRLLQFPLRPCVSLFPASSSFTLHHCEERRGSEALPTKYRTVWNHNVHAEGAHRKSGKSNTRPQLWVFKRPQSMMISRSCFMRQGWTELCRLRGWDSKSY